MSKLTIAAILAVLLHTSLSAQTYQPFQQIGYYTKAQKANRYDSSLRFLTNRVGSELHYLYPFYQAIGWEKRFKYLLGNKIFYDQLSQFLAFAGDYKKALELAERKYDTLTTTAWDNLVARIDSMKTVQYLPAKTTIIDMAADYQVIMINEAHHKPLHRVFVYSLLEDLYKKGYRYLAMESFGQNGSKAEAWLQFGSGFYTAEPIGAELIRRAIELGYSLVAYEDTNSTYNLSQRDSAHAANIYSIFQKDKNTKVLVCGGFTNIREDKPTEGYTPLGYWFKRISRINPLTIDQTEMTEGSNFEYGRLFYELFTHKFTIPSPSIINYNNRMFNPLETTGYDLIVTHPPTVYQQRRPTWLSFNGERKVVTIQPTARTLFFVQAFYDHEYDEKIVNKLVPADQTYTSGPDGYYYLWLKKGKYKIVLRDVGYKVLAVKDNIVE
jgi:hypothetical protein